MIAELTLLQIGIALAATLVSAFVRGLAGFGMAILLVPILGLAIAPSAAVVIANWLGLMIGLAEVRVIFRTSERSAFTIAGLAVAMTPLGVVLLASTDPAVARVLITLVAIGAFGLILLPQRVEGHVPSRTETWSTGVMSGILTGFAGMPGPPVVPYYVRRLIPVATARSSMLLIFLATSTAGVGSALVLGKAGWRELTLALALLPCVVVGNTLGARAFGRIGDRTWRLLVGGILAATALAAVWRLLHG